MALHRFAIGQAVHLKNGFSRSDAAGEIYRITAMLPERNNSPQYRIRSDGERHERVATEDTLDPINLPSPTRLLFKGDFHG